MIGRAAGFTLVSLLVACGGSALSEGDAARTLGDHLATVAPAGLPDTSWDRVRIEIESIEPDAETPSAHVVAFRAYDPGVAGEGQRGPVYTALLGRDEAGDWRVVRYGDDLKQTVAVMVTIDRKARYDTLLTALTLVQDSAAEVFRGWRRGLRARLPTNPDDPRFQRIVAELDAGIPAHQLHSRLAASLSAFPSALEWGVQGDESGGTADYVWVRDRARPAEECGQWISPVLPPPEHWLEGRFPTCRGRGGRYVDRVGQDAALREIEDAGGVMPTPARTDSR